MPSAVRAKIVYSRSLKSDLRFRPLIMLIARFAASVFLRLEFHMLVFRGGTSRFSNVAMIVTYVDSSFFCKLLFEISLLSSILETSSL